MDAGVHLSALAAALSLAACGGGGVAPAPLGNAGEPDSTVAPTAAELEALVFASDVTVPGESDPMSCGGWQLGTFANDHAYMLSMGEGGTTTRSECRARDGGGWQCTTVLVAPPCPPELEGCAPTELAIHYELDAARAIAAASVRCDLPA